MSLLSPLISTPLLATFLVPHLVPCSVFALAVADVVVISGATFVILVDF